MIFLSLINNVALIIALSIFYSFIIRRWKYGSRISQAISGFLFGVVAVVGMMNPLIVSPGLIFDGRSIIISVAGFIGGWVTALIAALMGIVYRTWIGGPGAIMGVSVIASSAAIGIAYHYIRRRRPHVAAPLYLIGFGIIVHICMLALTMTLPSGMRYEVFSNIAIPVILIYPLGTLLVCVVLLDLESRLQAEYALKKSEEKYRLVVENANEAILVAQDGLLKYINPMTLKILGYSDDLLTSRPFVEIIHPEDREKLFEAHIKRMRGEETQPVQQFRAIARDGTIRLADSHAIMISWEGKPATLNYITDITERRQAEEEKQLLEERLNRAEKMESLGLLAGGVAHDLNNVLGIVVGYAELLLRDMDHSNSTRTKLLNVMEGGQKAAAIVQDMLTLARRGVAGKNVMNLNSIISDYKKAPEFEQLSAFHPNIQIRTELEPDLPNISGSSVHLGKTIFNLVSNASEAMLKGGVLTIKTANQYLDEPIHGYDEIREGDYVVLSVSDTGEGINKADLKRIFEPFYTKKIMGRSGTGLGLAVVWGTVKDHNGYINVQSEEGKGSAFTLYFPVTREELSAEAASVDISEYMGKGESILIVDDVKGQRNLAEEMLRKLNYGVTSVSSGEEAVTYLKEHRVDLMVLDMIMDPGMDGLDTYRSVLEICPKQRAIIVSGFSESERVKAVQALGAGAYVKKPYVIEKLGLAVRKELDRAT